MNIGLEEVPKVPRDMYEVNWHRTNDGFSHLSVSKIKVIREGVMPGCSSMTITGIDQNGRKFQGHPDNYFDTEEEAWADAKADMVRDILELGAEIAKYTKEMNAMQDFLEKMENK